MRTATAALLAVMVLPVLPCAAAQDPSARALSSVYRFAAPPAGFDAVSASDSTLAAYGLPPRPSPFARSTLGYAVWARAMHAARQYVAPQVRITGRQHRPAADMSQRVSGASTSTNWAGEALSNSSTGYGPASYTEVMGQWVISGVQQAVGSCSGIDVSSTWVGIDGLSGNTDVLQAGTEADATCAYGATTQTDYAWYEWYPADEYEITNFPMVRGGSIFVVVQATSATSAIATFVNLQTGLYTVVGFGAPGGTYLKGNSAEWIVERPAPGTSKTPGTLADFGEIPMESEIGYLVSQLNTGSFNVPGSPGAGQSSSTLTMINTAGTTIATTVLQGTSAQLVQVEGPTE